MKIFDIDREDGENKQEFWEKIEGQNGFRKTVYMGKLCTNQLMEKPNE